MIPTSKILVADDDPLTRDYLNGLLLKDSCEMIFAEDGEQALKLAKTSAPDLLLLDVMMPKLTGLEVCRQIRTDPTLADVPIIMITALDDRNSRLQGIQAGADDFISKPFDSHELVARVTTIIRLNRYRRLHEEHEKYERLVKFSSDGIVLLNENGKILVTNPAFNQMADIEKESDVCDQTIEKLLDPADRIPFQLKLADLFSKRVATIRFETALRQPNNKPFHVEIHGNLTPMENGQAAQLIIHDITERKLSEQKLQKAHEKLVAAYHATVAGWALTLELRDIETSGHSQRVTDWSVKLAKMMGIKNDDLNEFSCGATLHDIGKIGIPDSILMKPDRLTAAEIALMRKHTQYAYNVLSKVGFSGPVVDIPHYHHERWDGTGYPEGLKGEEIPLSARIFAIIDVWDALSSDRPYRPAWPNNKVMAYIHEESGKHFDPKVVDAFLVLLKIS